MEILQLEQIRRLWEEFMTQLTSLNSSLSRNSERQEDGSEMETQADNAENTGTSLWTRRGGVTEETTETVIAPSTSPSVPQTSDNAAGPSSLPVVDLEDGEAVAAIEEAYEQISNNPVLEDDEIILLESSLSSSNTSAEANVTSSNSEETPNIPSFTENSARVSLSGQVPEDRPTESPASTTANLLRGEYPWERVAPENANRRSDTAASSSSTRSDNSTRNTSETSEEYQNTLLRANQIAVLRRLLTLLDRNEFPFDADAPARDSNSNSTPGSRADREPARNRDTTSRAARSGRGSPTEFLEELRSIQQSIVQRYDQMSMEIPSQEAMQRDLDRIVNLEAAVRERLRLSEDNFERSLLDNREGSGLPPSQQRTPGSPWSREIPLRRRLDPGDPNFVYWNSDLPINRSFLDDYTPVSNKIVT